MGSNKNVQNAVKIEQLCQVLPGQQHRHGPATHEHAQSISFDSIKIASNAFSRATLLIAGDPAAAGYIFHVFPSIVFLISQFLIPLG
jgi:hypothetical protein